MIKFLNCSINPLPSFCRQKLLAKEAELEELKEERDLKFKALPKWKQEIILKKQRENQPQ